LGMWRGLEGELYGTHTVKHTGKEAINTFKNTHTETQIHRHQNKDTKTHTHNSPLIHKPP
jgi:hypothetical protein